MTATTINYGAEDRESNASFAAYQLRNSKIVTTFIMWTTNTIYFTVTE